MLYVAAYRYKGQLAHQKRIMLRNFSNHKVTAFYRNAPRRDAIAQEIARLNSTQGAFLVVGAERRAGGRECPVGCPSKRQIIG